MKNFIFAIATLLSASPAYAGGIFCQNSAFTIGVRVESNNRAYKMLISQERKADRTEKASRHNSLDGETFVSESFSLYVTPSHATLTNNRTGRHMAGSCHKIGSKCRSRSGCSR